MLRVDVSKNSRTALSSNEGEFVTSTTTSAPASAPDSPSPVRVLTPEEGEADTASCPAPPSRGISFLPMSPLPPITTIFMPGLLECRPSTITGPVLIFPSLFLLFGDDDVLGVLRVQDDGDEARPVLLAGVPADAVQAAGRLVEGVTGLEDLGLVVVDGPLVLALRDVPERRAGVTVRRLHLARRQCHLDHRGLRLLPVQLLGDVPLEEQLDVIPAFAVLVVVCRAHPAGRERAHDDRQQGTSHDGSSERTGASDPSGNKDVEGGTVCDRREEHSRTGGALRGGGPEAARRPQQHEPEGANQTAELLRSAPPTQEPHFRQGSNALTPRPSPTPRQTLRSERFVARNRLETVPKGAKIPEVRGRPLSSVVP